MIVNNYFEITIKYNDVDLEIDPNLIKFSIHDSIWNFFSSATLDIPDLSGLLHEYMLDIEGGIFTISFGVKDGTILENKYVVTSNEIPNNATQGLVSGNLHLELLHEYYDYQVVKNKAYSSRVSEAVTSAISTYNFSGTNMNDTSSESIWYQLAQNQKDFIEKVLLPNAFSYNAMGTPFFAFIDSANYFNFRNYKSLVDTSNSSGITLKYNPENQNETDLYNIVDVKVFSTGSKITKFARNRTLVTRNYSTGEIETESQTISDFPSNTKSTLRIPIMDDENTNVTDYKYYNFTQESTVEQESLKAQEYFDQRKALCLQKLVITTMYIPDLHSGLTVDLKLAVASEANKYEWGIQQSGTYLIEDSIHEWNPNNKSVGYTYLIVSRKFLTVPNNYPVRSLLLS